MNFFRHQNHPQNDPRTPPETLWNPKWPSDPSWGLHGRLFGPQSRPKSIPKGPQRQPKTHQSGPMAPKWSPPVAISPPNAAPSAPQGTHFPSKFQKSTPNHQLLSKIIDFQLSAVHRRPTYVQRTSPNMGPRQCYAHQFSKKVVRDKPESIGNGLTSSGPVYLFIPYPG